MILVLLVPSVPSVAFAGDGDAAVTANTPASAASIAESDHQLVQQLKAQIAALQARVSHLEAKEEPTAPSGTASYLAASSMSVVPVAPSMPPTPNPAPTAPLRPPGPPQMSGDHAMDLPEGPKLNIRGFLDFNFDTGSAANPLIYPLTIPPPTTVHNTFQFGEFDLFMSSQLSNSIHFLSEAVFGSDATNGWGIDIERAQLTYKKDDYFQFSVGRMHTAIGYYNTAYHHGTWFQTATGRPYMYYYEDSGGILPVHLVGISATGLVPYSGSLNLHWIAELGNETSSAFIGQPNVNEPVQNFVSDSNHKAFNLAGYIRPDWLSGLQIGGNFYNSKRVPDGVPHVDNTITGGYLIYITPVWEFMGELQDQRDRSYRPYFRWQEVNVPANDPLYGSVGRYEGPSVGLRMDFSGYAAFKMQYNRLYTRGAGPANGLNSQVAFTF
jgi:hypothetical protein